MRNKMSLEEKALEYWFTLEFLGQDKYPKVGQYYGLYWQS